MIMLTVKDIAAELKVSKSLVYRWLARGEIAWYELDGCKRVYEADLHAYLQRHRREGSPQVPAGNGRHF